MMMKTSITFIVISSLMALLPQLRAAPSTYGRTFSDRTAASKLLAMLQQTFEAEKEFATVDKEIARVQGTGFDSRGCYKTLLQINPELRGFNEKYKNDFHIEIVCAHPTPKCTTVALKQSGKPLKYLELCEMATDSDRQCRGGSEYLQQGSCLEGYSGTIRTIIPVGSGCTSHVIGDISYIVSGGSLTCLAFEDFNVPTC